MLDGNNNFFSQAWSDQGSFHCRIVLVDYKFCLTVSACAVWFTGADQATISRQHLARMLPVQSLLVTPIKLIDFGMIANMERKLQDACQTKLSMHIVSERK